MFLLMIIFDHRLDIVSQLPLLKLINKFYFEDKNQTAIFYILLIANYHNLY